MILEVLGTGCAKCKALHQAVTQAVSATGVDAEVRKIEDIAAIIERGVISTPALLKDGQVLVAGKVPSAAEIARWIAA